MGRKELKAEESAAIARKQPDPFPMQKILLSLAVFGAVSALLYMYMNYVLTDDDDDEAVLAAAAAAAAAAAQKKPTAATGAG